MLIPFVTLPGDASQAATFSAQTAHGAPRAVEHGNTTRALDLDDPEPIDPLPADPEPKDDLGGGADGEPAGETPDASLQDDQVKNEDSFVSKPSTQSFAPVCAVGYVYAISSNGQMQQISPAGVVTAIGTPSPGSNLNGLGIADDGTAYATNRSGSSGSSISGTVYRYNSAIGTWSRISNTTDISASSNLVGGAVGPDGAYWAGGFNSNGNFPLWKLNAAGNGMDRKGSLIIPVSGTGNGDITFDSVGNMYLLRNSGSQVTIYRASKADLDAATTNSQIPVTEFYNNGNLTTGVNGITYDASGRLYLGTGSTLRWFDIANPSQVTQVSLNGTMNSTDLASCSYPPTVRVQKNLPDGRFASEDEFGLVLKQGGTVNNGVITGGTEIGSATASSPASGLQDQTAGPVPITFGTTVTFAETFTNGASAAHYTSEWKCSLEGETTPLATGSGTAGSLVVPQMGQGKEITCEFVNTMINEATLTLVKEVVNPAVGTGYAEAGDWDLTATGSGAAAGTALNGQTGTTEVTRVVVLPGEYTLSEEFSGSGDQGPGYIWSELVCADSVGTPLLSDVFSADKTDGVVSAGSVTLRAGDDVTCTYTNTPKLGSASWLKVDDRGEPLEGAEWRLTGPTGFGDLVLDQSTCAGPGATPTGEAFCTYTATGQFEVSNLQWGSYSLEETRAPAGHYPIEDPLTFEITGNALTIALNEVENPRMVGPEIPLTGGLGRDFYTIAGLSILLLGAGAVAAILLRNRRKEAA